MEAAPGHNRGRPEDYSASAASNSESVLAQTRARAALGPRSMSMTAQNDSPNRTDLPAMVKGFGDSLQAARRPRLVPGRPAFAGAGCSAQLDADRGWPVQRASILPTRLVKAGDNSAHTAGIVKLSAPARATTTSAAEGINNRRSVRRKLSRSRRLTRLRTTALPISRDTVTPRRGTR